MKSYRKVQLCEVADIKLSNVDKKTKPHEREIKLCNYTDVYNNSFISKNMSNDFMIASCSDNEYKNFILRKGQVAVTKDSEKTNDIGIPTYISENFSNVVLGYHLALFTPNSEKLDGKFLYYWLNTKQAKQYFENNAGGSGQRCSLPLDILKEIPLSIPSVQYQNEIAQLLFKLDAKIELNNRINNKLEQITKTLYDYWFVQFDFPNEKGKPYRSSGGKMVYNEKLKREIPEEWEVRSLSHWINADKGGDWGRESEEGNYTEKVNCIRGTDIKGLIGKGELKTPIRYILEKNSSKILQLNDLIIEISGGSPTQSTGRLAYITEGTFERFDNPIICSNFCKAINLKDENQLYYFAYYWNLIYDNNILFGWEGKTSGIKNLLFDSFVNHYKIPVPDESLIEKFNDFVKPIEAQKQKKLKENQELASLRDWLLPMLMNGQVTVKEAEEKLDMAAEPNIEYTKK